MDNISELNELMNTGAKLSCNEIGIPLKNPNRKTKSVLEIRQEGQIKKLWQQAKILRKAKQRKPTERKDPKKTNADKSAIHLEEIKRKILV